MTKTFSYLLVIIMSSTIACNDPQPADKKPGPFPKGTLGYDLEFLSKYDSVVVLKSPSDSGMVLVSPKYQAKVFTSSATGMQGLSFGWVNYKAFSAPVDPHMNAYGGENRFWLGPEGGQFSLYFQPGAEMIFDNWKTPAAIDTEPWDIAARSTESITLKKQMELFNYKGTRLSIAAERTITILNGDAINKRMGITADSSVQVVGYETQNTIKNTGAAAWTEETGMPCIWMLDMFNPTPSTVIVVPFKTTTSNDFSTVATTNYFGDIAADRLKRGDSVLFFKADGKSRGKLGTKPAYVKPYAGSFDSEHGVLTITEFDTDSSARYLNQEWSVSKPPFSGDAMNAYNDGPLEDGSQMGPFYEIESVSPAAFLKPGEKLAHHHHVYHFTGNKTVLNTIAQKFLGVSLQQITESFK